MTPDNISSSVEQQLGDHFETITTVSSPHPDVDDLVNRLRSSYRRQRVSMIGAALVALVVTGIGGYKLGSDEQPLATTIAADTDATTTIVPTPANVPAGVIGYDPAKGPGQMQVSQLFTRETPDHIGVRVHRYESNQLSTGQEASTSPFCTGWAPLSVGLSTDDVVALGSVLDPQPSTMPENFGPAFTLGTAGAITGPDFVILAVGGVNGTVSATFPNGVTDSMDAINGVAVLVGQVGAADFARLRDMEVIVGDQHRKLSDFDAGYASPSRVIEKRRPGLDTPISSGDLASSINIQVDCTQKLPATGSEQPQDPQGARSAIETAVHQLYDANLAISTRVALLDDPTGADAGLTAVLQGSFSKAARSADASLSELVFTSATKAEFKYSIKVDPGEVPLGYLDHLIGSATLIDGQWKITNSTLCSVLGMAGSGCTPDGQRPPPDSPGSEVFIPGTESSPPMTGTAVPPMPGVATPEASAPTTTVPTTTP